MTYNSTDRILFQAVETGKLVRRKPLKSLAPDVRSLYVTPGVDNGLDGNDKLLAHLPMREMERLIAIYLAGYTSVTVSMNGLSAKKPDFERLRNLPEVWALCARKPKFYQVRMFGRFIAPGKFIGLALHDRRALGAFQSYHNQASIVPQLWTSAIGDVSPYTAPEAQDYLGGECRDVDQV